MTTSPHTEHRTAAPVATPTGRTSRPFTESLLSRLVAFAAGVVVAVLLTAGALQSSTPDPGPGPSPGPWPSAPTCAELYAARSTTSHSCGWYRSRALEQAERLRSCAQAPEYVPALSRAWFEPTPV
ncbi:hypothetical protein [Cellulomonas sp. ICMP 17802]|uniref:hypothetical protein n=1 Tax=Cellulomonas sp. ICMP 17802 TaxID=3239199 RepID=UPI00351BB3BE